MTQYPDPSSDKRITVPDVWMCCDGISSEAGRRCVVVSYCYIRASTYLHTLSPVSALLIRSNSSRQGRHHSTVLRTGRGLLIAPPSTLHLHLNLDLDPLQANNIPAEAGILPLSVTVPGWVHILPWCNILRREISPRQF